MTTLYDAILSSECAEARRKREKQAWCYRWDGYLCKNFSKARKPHAIGPASTGECQPPNRWPKQRAEPASWKSFDERSEAIHCPPGGPALRDAFAASDREWVSYTISTDL